MFHRATTFGKTAKLTLAALGLGAVALPLASALASPEDPTQVPAAAAADAAPALAPAAVVLTVEQATAARGLFTQYSCGACHTLAAGGGSGQIGPSLDGNTALDHEYVKNRISNGQGAMPSFGGMIPADQLDQLATYIMAVKK